MKENNKSTKAGGYGAPELKCSYWRNFFKGLEIAVILHGVLLGGYLILYSTGFLNAGELREKPFIIREYDIKDIVPPSINEDVPQIKDEEIVKPVKDLASLDIKPVAKDISELQTIKTQQELDNSNLDASREGDSLIAGNFTGMPEINDKTIDKNKDKDKDKPPKETFTELEVDVAPECINLDNVKHSIVYPQIAREAGIEGRVTVKVLVGADGHVMKTGAISGPEVFHDEVKEKAMQLEFSAGLQNNKPVKVWVNVPFNFKLK